MKLKEGCMAVIQGARTPKINGLTVKIGRFIDTHPEIPGVKDLWEIEGATAQFSNKLGISERFPCLQTHKLHPVEPLPEGIEGFE